MPLTSDGYSSKLQRQMDAIRRNKHSVGHMFLFLCEDPPNASAAKECLDEIEHKDQTDIWSCSTKNGGVWETWERDALKYGDLDTTRSYETWRISR